MAKTAEHERRAENVGEAHAQAGYVRKGVGIVLISGWRDEGLLG